MLHRISPLHREQSTFLPRLEQATLPRFYVASEADESRLRTLLPESASIIHVVRRMVHPIWDRVLAPMRTAHGAYRTGTPGPGESLRKRQVRLRRWSSVMISIVSWRFLQGL